MKQFLKTLFWFAKKIAFGFVCFYSANLIGSFVGINLVSNIPSYLTIGVLGIPGLIIIYVLNVLFIA